MHRHDRVHYISRFSINTPARYHRSYADDPPPDHQSDRPTQHRTNINFKECISWARAGKCRYGDRCIFAHSRGESGERINRSTPSSTDYTSTAGASPVDAAVLPTAQTSAKLELDELERVLSRVDSTLSKASDTDSSVTELPQGGCRGSVDPPALRRCKTGELCGICLTSIEDEQDKAQPCLSPECTAAFHRECTGEYISRIVEGSRYTCPQIRCAGVGCGSRIPTHVWQQFVPGRVYKDYGTNAAALMTIRCEPCDEQFSLFCKDEVSESCKQELKERLLEKVEAWGGDTEQLVGALEQYQDGGIDVQTMAQTLFSAFEDAEGEAFMYEEPLNEDLYSPHPVHQLILSYDTGKPALIPGLLTDLERRAMLQLECLRRFPFIQTPCCHAPLCFKCKTMYHHPGETCAERMKLEIGDGKVQCCPGCGVPTVKVEACDHIICVCGQSWDWEICKECDSDY